MRQFARLLAVSAAVLALAEGPTAALADGISSATYELTIPGGLPDPGPDVKNVNAGVTLPQLEAKVVPAGGIVPPTLQDGTQGSPLTILPDSFGFDQDKLVVALNNSPKDNPTDQKFGLVFFNGGLAPDNNLHFSLSVNDALSTPPTLEITSPGSVSGQVLTAIPDSIPTTVDPSVTSVNTPEPLSILVWSGLAGLGLTRARGLRRRHPASA